VCRPGQVQTPDCSAPAGRPRLGVGLIFLSLLVAALHGGVALSQTVPYPNRAIRFIVTSPAGGANDIQARTLGAKLAEQFPQPVLIDNRAGASGMIAAEMVAKAPPDGYTVLMGTDATLAVNPHLFAKVPYDVQRDFAPISINVGINYVLLVHPSVPAKSVQELIAFARAYPGKLNYASSGNGSAFHLGMELLKTMAGVDIVHVPFKGSALSVNAMLAGEVQVMLIGLTTGMPLAKSGRLRALAVASAKRSSIAPELPTIAESGLSGYDVDGWFGAVAPRGTPEGVIARLHDGFARALQQPELRERLASQGYEVIASTPEQMAAQIQSDARKWAKVIRDSGAKPD